MNNTTADPSLSPLVAEISRLQRELDRANESIDDKLDKLEDAGSGVVGLTRKLEDARAKIVALEDEIARLSRKEDRRMRRLERARCQKCHTRVDLRAVNQAVEADERSVWHYRGLNPILILFFPARSSRTTVFQQSLLPLPPGQAKP